MYEASKESVRSRKPDQAFRIYILVSYLLLNASAYTEQAVLQYCYSIVLLEFF